MGKVLALDLGGTKIYSALVDGEGKIIREDIRPTMSDGGFSLVADRILDSLYSVMPEGEHPAGVGVAVPAYIDPHTDTIIFSPNLKWHNVDLKKKIEDALGMPVWLENDANLAENCVLPVMHLVRRSLFSATLMRESLEPIRTASSCKAIPRQSWRGWPSAGMLWVQKEGSSTCALSTPMWQIS
jgi:hypothetical protein